MATHKIEFKEGSLATKGKILRPGTHFVDDKIFPELVELARTRKGVTVTQEDEPKVVEVAKQPKPLEPELVDSAPSTEIIDVDNNVPTLVGPKPTARTAAKRGRPRKTAA